MLKSIIFALTLTGTFIGAGFATGQEMLSFFVIHNPKTPLYFILSVSVIFLCVFMISAGKEKNTCELYTALFGEGVGKLMNAVSVASLFICYGACLAGMGRMFFESLYLPYLSGAILLSVISFGACIYGIKGISTVNGLLTPFIIITVILFGSLSTVFPDCRLVSLKNTAATPAVYSFLYAGYNIFPLIPIVTAEKKGKWGIVVSFLLTVTCGTIMFLSLSSNPALSFASQIPFYNIIKNLFPAFSAIYALSICASLVTTGASCLFGVISALEDRVLKLPLYIICFVLSFVFVLFGFTGTVRIFYPLSGFFGLFLIVRILLSGIFKK